MPDVTPPAQGRQQRTPRRQLVVPTLPNQVHAPTQARRYYTIFFKFMEWKLGNGNRLADDHLFTEEEKRSIRPLDVHRWFCLMAYGKENPTPEDNPTRARESTLVYYKKSISFFMDTNEHWNDTHKTGNPTRSRLISPILAFSSLLKRNPWCWKRCSSWQILHWEWNGTAVKWFQSKGFTNKLSLTFCNDIISTISSCCLLR